MLFSFAGDDASDSGRLGVGQRVEQQRHPLEWREPRHGENVVVVRLAAVGTLRRRRVERLGLDASPPLQASRDGARDRKDLPDILRQQPAIRGMDQPASGAFLDPSLPSQRRAERVPLIVVLTHRVVQPDDVIGVADRVARISERNDLIDRSIVVPHAHVGEPCREIRARPVVRIGFAASVPALLRVPRRAAPARGRAPSPDARLRQITGRRDDTRHRFMQRNDRSPRDPLDRRT